MSHSLSKHLATLAVSAALISAASTSVAFAYVEPPVVGSPFDSSSDAPPALGDGGNSATPPALGSSIDNSSTNNNSNLNNNNNNNNYTGCTSNCGYNNTPNGTTNNPTGPSYMDLLREKRHQQLIELAKANGANSAPDTLDPNATTDAATPTPKKGTRLPKTGPEMLPMLITSMLATTGYRLYRKKHQT